MRRLLLLPLLALAACRSRPAAGGAAAPDTADAGRVVAVDPQTARAARAALAPVDGSGVEGTVSVVDVGEAARVVAEVDGLPGRDRFFALQVLASGACADLGDHPPHFDPDGAPHGPFDAARGARHAGDLGNLRGYDGHGRYDRFDPLLALADGRSAVGHAVVVRAGPDDAYSAPDGNAGAVLACGVLEAR